MHTQPPQITLLVKLTCLAERWKGELDAFNRLTFVHHNYTLGTWKGWSANEILRDNIQGTCLHYCHPPMYSPVAVGIIKPTIRRLTRRGSVKRISGTTHCSPCHCVLCTMLAQCLTRVSGPLPSAFGAPRATTAWLSHTAGLGLYIRWV